MKNAERLSVFHKLFFGAFQDSIRLDFREYALVLDGVLKRRSPFSGSWRISHSSAYQTGQAAYKIHIQTEATPYWARLIMGGAVFVLWLILKPDHFNE